jgi:hypothetical protein
MEMHLQWRRSIEVKRGVGGRRTDSRSARGARAAAATPDLQVQVSTDGKSWSAPLATATGSTLTTFAFKPTRAKFVRITRNAPAPNDAPWTIQNLRLFRAAAAQ